MRTYGRMIAVAVALAACAGAEHREARDRYNEGIAALTKKDYDGAEKALLAARDQARVDPELRYRAAFNLGLALAAHADQLRAAQPPDPQGALDRLRQAAGWFRDALRLRDKDPDAAAALEHVLARARALSDELARGENGLEPRLDRLIDDQRGLRDSIQAAWLELEHAGAAGADPLAGQKKLTELADRERVILTEAGVVGDLAADEIDGIGKKTDDERTDEQKVRVVQLQNLDIYLQDARAGLGNARRKLQELTPGPAHASAENALASLKRAREQLLDPIAALQGIAGDEVALYQETDYLLRAHLAERSLDAKEPPPVVPAWLTTDSLAMRQGTLRERVDEVRARLDAAVQGAEQAAAGAGSGATAGSGGQPQTGLMPDPGAPASGTGTGTGAAPAAPPQDPKAAEQARMIALVKAALPSVTEASAAMERAKTALTAGKADDGVRAEADALIALGRAIERFADLRHAIDLAWAEQEHVVQMLDAEAAKDVKPADRARVVKEGTAKNLERMGRIAELIAEQRQQVDAQAAAAAAAPPPAAAPGQPAPKAEDAKAQLDAEKERLARAEELRGQAATALAAVAAALASGKDPVAPAREADARLAELRELFFSVIEHLQQLVRDQGETRDRTAKAKGLDELARTPVMPDLVTRQTDHAAMGQAIQDALAKQADAAAAQPGAQGPQAAQAAEAAKNLTAAVDELRLGVGEMQGARDQLVKAKDATNASYNLSPTLDGQGKAIEHLKNALRLLQPPKQDQQPDPQQKQQQQQQQQQGQGSDQKDQQGKDSKDQQQQQQQQQQQGKDGKDQDPSGALQRVRDDEARRQRERERRDRERAQPEPVDKDW